ncbi:MAG: hypothetical protein RR954_06220, partial [Christensenellaceae bacterium]
FATLRLTLAVFPFLIIPTPLAPFFFIPSALKTSKVYSYMLKTAAFFTNPAVSDLFFHIMNVLPQHLA